MAWMDNLESYWRLAEISGTRVDSHGSNDLTDNNTVPGEAGKINIAAHFDNANSESLSIADNTSLSMGDIDFAIACWVNQDTQDTREQYVTKWATGSNREYALYYVQSVDRFRFTVRDVADTGNTNVDADNLGSPSTGTWYFIVVEHDASANTISIQVNNGTIDSAAHSGGVIDGAAAFRIGATSAEYSDGFIDEVGVWKRTLTTAERTALYNGGAGLSYPFERWRNHSWWFKRRESGLLQPRLSPIGA